MRESAQEKRNEIERHTAELHRKTEQTLYQARLLDLANDAIFVRTANDRISYWNEGAERLYGWKKEEALGRSTHELLHAEFPVPLSEIKKRSAGRENCFRFSATARGFTVASRWTTTGSQRRLAGWLEINTDVTLRKRAETAARRLSGRILESSGR